MQLELRDKDNNVVHENQIYEIQDDSEGVGAMMADESEDKTMRNSQSSLMAANNLPSGGLPPGPGQPSTIPPVSTVPPMGLSETPGGPQLGGTPGAPPQHGGTPGAPPQLGGTPGAPPQLGGTPGGLLNFGPTSGGQPQLQLGVPL